MQTYDFSDFVKLAEMENVKTIMFQNKFYNADSADAVKNIDYAFKDGTAVKKLDNIADLDTNKNVNKWQKFTDYYGRDTDVLGNILSDSDKNQSCIYIISTGDHNTTSQAYATKGEWATKWCVYDNNGNLITCGTPADFLDKNSAQYTALNKEEYRNKPVKISYEKGSKYGNGYSRSDGRWYYSALGQEFTSDVAIEYKGDDDTYIADKNTNTANTGFIGEKSGATAHTGTGFYYISAVLYDQTGAVKHSYAETQGKISIDDFAATDSLEITLRAKCHGDNTVYALYKGEAGGYTKIGPKDKDLRGESEFTYTFTVLASSLFENGELAVNALNYYTDIVKVGGTCDITYK